MRSVAYSNNVTVPPYDNKEYRYRHTDADRREGLARVAELLGITQLPTPTNVLYDLSFFSGGIGVLDQLAATVDADASLWARVRAGCGTPKEIAAHPGLSDWFLWLLRGDKTEFEARDAAVLFINAHRRDFQGECRPSDTILFSQESDVKDWKALWGTPDRLHVMAYSQG